MKHKTWINLIVVLGLLFTSSNVLSPAAARLARAEVNATILYVTNGATGGCSSWADACSLQHAVLNAVPDTEIWVAAGTYKYGVTRVDSLEMENGVAIYGGFTGTETNRDDRDENPATNGTVLSGDIGTEGVASDNRYHVITASGTDSTAVLDGFTITGGNANFQHPDSSLSDGGGIYIINSNPTLRNLIISGNSAFLLGGGMYNSGSSPKLTNVTFSGNSAGGPGGGMFNSNSSPTLINVTFSGNSAVEGGGMNNWGSSPTLTNVLFSGNSAAGGGGMLNLDSSPTLTNVTFNGNSAEVVGGGMVNWDSSPSVRNSILWNNQDSSGTGTITATISNDSSTITLTHSLIQGSGGSASWSSDASFVDGGDNLDSDPLFVDADGADDLPGTDDDDLRLQPTSPAIDAGDNQYITIITTDLGGNPRISDGDGDGSANVDMGAYEVQNYHTFLPLVPNTINVSIYKVKPGGSGNCSSWELACELQTALGLAVAGEEIWVAEGAYLPGTQPEDTFQLASGVALYGGFNGTETSREQRDPRANPTILSGSHPLGEYPEHYHVVSASSVNSSTILDGFTIRGGRARGNEPHDKGGGMFIESGSPQIVNVIFTANISDSGGNGLYNRSGSPRLKDCTFRDNKYGTFGGGVLNEGMMTIDSSTIYANDASSLEGGFGGGIANTGTMTITNSTISRNSASGFEQKWGGGLFNDRGAVLTLIHTTITDNTSDSGGDGISNEGTVYLSNTIIAGNGDNDCEGWISYGDLGYNLIGDGSCGFPVGGDPLLGPLQDNGGLTWTHALLAGSPAVDAGDCYGGTLLVDQRGVPRPQGAACDIGSFEEGSITMRNSNKETEFFD